MGANQFIPLPPIPPGAFGLQAPVDLAAVVPPSGLDEHLTFICKGDFVNGYIAIMGSPDGVNYDVLTQFTSGGDADALPGPSLEFSPRTLDATIRFVLADVRATVRGPTPTQITLGGEEKCDCVSGGGPTVQPCLVMTLDEDGEREVVGTGEQLVEEWFVDFTPLFGLGPGVLTLFSGIFETLTTDDTFWRVRLGATSPGSIAGSAIINTIHANSASGTFTASTGNIITNPAFTAQLVQVTIEPGRAGTQDAFIRGFVVQFTCQPPA